MPPPPLHVLVAITFHYRKDRLQYLFQLIRAFADYPVELLDLRIVTNAEDEESLRAIRDLCSPLLHSHPSRAPNTKTLTIESWPKLADPWHLPWCHKHLITDEFLKAGSGLTHFIYLEDDILLPADHFLYFVHYRPLLRPYGLIPSFQRIELNSRNNRLYLADQVGLSDFSTRQSIALDQLSFVNPDYPYDAMFILDRDLAREYVQSASFDRTRSASVRPQWGLAERAAMGLCFENPPPGFSCRYAIPVETATLRMPYWAWIYHIAPTYCTNPQTLYGKTPPEELFGSNLHAVNWRPPTAMEKVVRLVKRIAIRVRNGAPRSTGNDNVIPGRCLLCDRDESESDRCTAGSCPVRFVKRKAVTVRTQMPTAPC